MILTCPSCATRFQVDPATFGASPRKVRCSRCRATWQQEPLPEPEPIEPAPPVVEQTLRAGQAAADSAEDDWVPPPPPGGKPPAAAMAAPPPPPVLDLSPVAPPAGMAAPRITGFDDDLLDRELDRPPLHPPLDEPLSGMGDDDPDEALKRRRARLAEAGVHRPPAAKPKKPRSWAWLGWLLLLALLGGLAGGGYEKRTELVAFYPPLAKLYERLGIPVDTAQWLGLELHSLKSATVLENGQTKVAVSGEVVNVGGAERGLPAIRIAMRGAGGQDLGAFTIKLEQSMIGADERLSFNVQLPAPKDEVTDLEVAFANQTPAP